MDGASGHTARERAAAGMAGMGPSTSASGAAVGADSEGYHGQPGSRFRGASPSDGGGEPSISPARLGLATDFAGNIARPGVANRQHDMLDIHCSTEASCLPPRPFTDNSPLDVFGSPLDRNPLSAPVGGGRNHSAMPSMAGLPSASGGRPMPTSGLGQAVQSYLQNLQASAKANNIEAKLPNCFPPKHLFTCTVGRNRSKARCVVL